ncbi:MAG: multicopper oxidase domain-containing protein [Anaerolineales bacterium]|nr:multicopper oxidase domain-containing protein [Anaerolineales bacterium]
MTNRRGFLKVSAAAGAGALLATKFGFIERAYAQIPGGTLLPGDVPKFETELVKPPAMLGSFRKNKDKYKIAVRQFQQQILPDTNGLPMTTVWSYGPADARTTTLADGYFYPAFTVEATANKTTQVLWRNQLIDPATGNFLPHLLPVDQTLHWANPPGGLAGRDKRPTFTTTPGPYTGPVPMIVHVHGAHTSEDSDGYPEAWYLPDANNIPAGYAKTGTFFDYFNGKYGHGWAPGTAAFKYPNDQPATTLWYHDHTLGMTRLNVYAGPAGFWLIRGGDYDANLGYVAPGVGDNPLGEYTEIPIAIQDRSFNDSGSLFYPDNRAFFDGFEGPFIPTSNVPPIWNPEFFGNMMVVNGRTWPYLEVERRRYRFRLLNGCNSRFLLLKLTTSPRSDNDNFNTPDSNVKFWQIGAEQGFLPNAVELNQLLMAPAERADVIIDFSNVPTDNGNVVELYLVNDGPDAPFGGISTEDLSDWESTGLVMKFKVKPGTVTDDSVDPSLGGGIALPKPPALGAAPNTFNVTLNEEVDNVGADVPSAALLGSGTTEGGLLWSDEITENPAVDSTEQWSMYNFTEDAHPIHVHLVKFQVVERLPFGGGTSTAGQNTPLPWETGFKDTVIAYPGEITRIKAKYDLGGLFVWHCHIVEHEDNEMMRPYHIGPIDPNAPLPDNEP